MKFLLVGLALARDVALRQTTCNCGYTNYGRFVRGKKSRPNEYPWMVALANRKGQFCGAGIISPYHVLTAAQCTEDVSAYTLNVTIGTHNIAGGLANKGLVLLGWILPSEYHAPNFQGLDEAKKPTIIFFGVINSLKMVLTINK